MSTSTDQPVKSGLTEDAVFRKVTLRIVPFLMLCYIASYLDRVNVGFAKLQMSAELGFSEAAFGLGAGLFFIGYFLFEVPSNLLLQKVGARVWIARIMITWGLISGASIFVTNETTFYIQRFLLGLAEAGFYPGVILYCTYWFPSQRRAKIIALFMSAIPIAGIFGNPLSGWIMNTFDGSSGLSGWQWVFVLESIPALLIGIWCLFYLDRDVRSATWLSEDEKAVVARAVAEDSAHKNVHGKTLESFKQPKVWLMAFIYLCFVMGQYALTFWMPTFVESTGVENALTIGILSAIPFVTALVAMNLFGRSADRRRERRWHLVIPALMGTVGFSMAAVVEGNIVLSLIALSIAAAGVLTCAPLFWSLPTSFLGGTAAAAGIAVINSVGNLAGFLSPYMIGAIMDATDSTDIPMFVLAASLVIGAVAVLTTNKNTVNR